MVVKEARILLNLSFLLNMAVSQAHSKESWKHRKSEFGTKRKG